VHVLCRDISAASRLLHIAVSCGYRESGFSISALGSPQEKVLVAIRTNAIRAEIPLASYDQEASEIRPFGLTCEYLVNLISIMNEKFAENNSRKQRLQDYLRPLFGTQEIKSLNETKEERRNRKRLEGLRTQAAKKDNQTEIIEPNMSRELDVFSDDVHLDQLITL
jgi:tRNA wybutosine-synthesizing protein 3